MVVVVESIFCSADKVIEVANWFCVMIGCSVGSLITLTNEDKSSVAVEILVGTVVVLTFADKEAVETVFTALATSEINVGEAENCWDISEDMLEVFVAMPFWKSVAVTEVILLTSIFFSLASKAIAVEVASILILGIMIFVAEAGISVFVMVLPSIFLKRTLPRLSLIMMMAV